MSSAIATNSEIAGAQALSLSSLVNYQAGSVGNVTLFAFDEGQVLSERTCQLDALVYAIEGEAEITVAGKPFLVKPGQVVLLPADKPRAVKAITRFKMVLTMIRS